VTDTNFNGKFLKVLNKFRVYLHLEKFDETYEIILPNLSVHNLIIGTMYVDIGETMTIVNLKRQNERCEVRFERRGWFSAEEFKF